MIPSASVHATSRVRTENLLLLALIANSLAGWFVLPRLVAAHPSQFFFRAWFWLDLKAALYGWMPLATVLLAWEFFVWRKIRKHKPMPAFKGWVSRKLLTFVLAAGFAPVIPWWIPAGQPSDKALAALNDAGQPLIVQDVAQDPRWLTTFGTSKAEAIFPVTRHGAIVGTIDVESERVGAFTAADEEFLRGAAAVLQPLWATDQESK